MDDTSEVYRHFLLGKQDGLILRPGSLISENSNVSIPSPKGISTNIKCLPNFSDQIIKIESKKKIFNVNNSKKIEYSGLPYELFKVINPRKVNK